MNRRDFLQTTLAAAMLPRGIAWATADRKIEKIGMQLYTVRDLMKRDFEGTLARVAAIGYQEVEFAGYFDHPPQTIRAALDRNGLAGISAHMEYASLGAPWPKVLEAAQVIGQSYIVCPWIEEEQRKEPDGWKRAAEAFNRAGEASLKAGIQFGYHNHDFEFHPEKSLGGKLPYDVLLAETDPHLVKMQMDLCWITEGGQDPLAYFDRYPGRFPMVHVKDMTKAHKMTEVGSGAIDWKRIFAQSEKAGIRHYFVEHDQPKDPFESLRISHDYLKKLRF